MLDVEKGVFAFKFENLLVGEGWECGETAYPSSHLNFIFLNFFWLLNQLF